MLRTWKLIGCNTILTTALVAAPSPAQTDGPASLTQKVDDIQKTLGEMRKELGELKTAMAPLANIQKGIEDLAANLKLKTEAAKFPSTDDLRDQISGLKTAMQELRDRLSDGTRISGFRPPEASAPAPTARIELSNTYDREASIVVNGLSYRLLPGDRVVVPIAAGTFTYEVLNVTPLRTRSVAANSIFTIQVHPQS